MCDGGCERITAELLARVAELEEGAKRMMLENTALAEENVGLTITTKKQASTIAGLTSELRKIREESPQAKDIRFVLTRWRQLTGHLRSAIGPETDRWAMVNTRLKHSGLEDTVDAVQGVALAPHMHFGRYRMTPCGKAGCCKRRDDIKDFMKDSGRFEELVDIARRAARAPSERLFEALQRVSIQDDLLSGQLKAALNREAAEKLLAEADPEVRAGRTPVDAVVFDLRQRRVA